MTIIDMYLLVYTYILKLYVFFPRIIHKYLKQYSRIDGLKRKLSSNEILKKKNLNIFPNDGRKKINSDCDKIVRKVWKCNLT